MEARWGLLYQHGSAIPDMFSMRPETLSLPPLRSPAQQQSERTRNSLLQGLKDINVRFLLTAGQVILPSNSGHAAK